MRILWLHQYFATPQGWGAVRTYEFARRFVGADHAVDVVCSAGYDQTLKRTGRDPIVVDGVRVFVSGAAYASNMGFVLRVVSFLRFMLGALWFVMRHGKKYDMCIASSGPLTMAVPALLGRLVHRVPYVFEVIDVWPDSAIAAGVLKNRLLQRMSFLLERLAYRFAGGIVTCSTGMTDRIINKFQGKSASPPENRNEINAFAMHSISVRGKTYKIQTISNSCDLDHFHPDESVRKTVRASNGVRDDQLVALYSGAMGVSNEIDDLIGAITATQGNDNIIWWLAGDGIRAKDVKALAEDSGRVRYFGKLSKIEVAALYRAADVNLITFMHNPLFYENSPNKFFDGIAAGLPAVFNRSTWLEPWLTAYACGVVCEADENAGLAMAEALCALEGNFARRQSMSVGARRLAEDVFSRDRLAKEYLRIITTTGQRH